ncbi:MAG: phosphotransferase enzyme family protein [Planctomycetales bacterium]|jgi:Ser/Thr protein kinase RdoA (MazF antagonist)
MLSEFDQANRVLRQHFPHVAQWSGCRIESVSGGFSGAGVFKVETANTGYCLRRWPVAQTSAARVLAVHQLLALAQDRGVSIVPVSLKSNSGTTLAEVNGEWWQLEPWMPGVADFLAEPSDERLESAMTQLARFHNAVRDWVPAGGVGQWFQPRSNKACPTITHRIRMIDGYASSITDFNEALAQESDTRFRDAGVRIALLFRSAHSEVKQELIAVESLPVPLQPCIRDLWHDHLLFQGDELSGIVDFGAMATDSITCDLSRLLGSLFGDDSAAWQRGIGYYESVRTMTEAEHRLLRSLDRSSILLSGMTWLKRRYVLRNTPADISRVCDRLDAILVRLSSLALDS